MGPEGFDPETTLRLHQFVLYYLACVIALAALIGLALYIFLVGSEMLFSQRRSKVVRVTAPRPAQCPAVVEERLDLPAAEVPILPASWQPD